MLGRFNSSLIVDNTTVFLEYPRESAERSLELKR